VYIFKEEIRRDVCYMIVKDLVEARELLIEETGNNVFVVYERYENVDCHCEGKNVEEIECDPEEIVKILVDTSDASLRSVKTYELGEDFTSVEGVLTDIRQNYGHFLNG